MALPWETNGCPVRRGSTPVCPVPLVRRGGAAGCTRTAGVPVRRAPDWHPQHPRQSRPSAPTPSVTLKLTKNTARLCRNPYSYISRQTLHHTLRVGTTWKWSQVKLPHSEPHPEPHWALQPACSTSAAQTRRDAAEHSPRRARRIRSSSSHSTCPPSGWWRWRCWSCAQSSCPRRHSRPRHPAAGRRRRSHSGALRSRGHCETAHRPVSKQHTRQGSAPATDVTRQRVRGPHGHRAQSQGRRGGGWVRWHVWRAVTPRWPCRAHSLSTVPRYHFILGWGMASNRQVQR